MKEWPSLIDVLQESSALHADKLAMTDPQHTYTYAQFWDRVALTGSNLQHLGLKPADRVVLQMGNSCDFAVFYYAILYAGGVVCPLDDHLTSDICLDQTRNVGPTMAFLSQHNAQRHANHAPLLECLHSLRQCFVVGGSRLASSREMTEASVGTMWNDLEGCSDPIPYVGRLGKDLAQLVHTTGTTGHPKAVMLTHAQMGLGCSNITRMVAITSADTEVTTLPLVRLFGQFHLHAYLRAGGSLIIERNMLNPTATLKRVLGHQATSFPQVMSAFSIIMEDLPELLRQCDDVLRYVMLCSMRASREQLCKLQRHLPTTDIYNTYGLSEAVRCTSVNVTKDPAKIDSVGKPVSGVVVEVLDNEGKPVHPLMIGELAITSEHMFSGYWKNEMATAQVISDGRLLTGDLGYVDEDGYVHYVGRKTEEINVGGQKFMPQEIEDLVRDKAAGIEEVVVIPIPDPEGILGTVPFMYVLAAENERPCPRDIQRKLLRRVEPFKIPRYIEIVQVLPRSPSGKILLHKLIAMAAASIGRGGENASA